MMEDELAQLRAEVEWLQDALVLIVGSNRGFTTSSFPHHMVRRAVYRRLPDLERQVAERVARQQADRTLRVRFTGVNQAQLREVFTDASWVEEGGTLWMVYDGKSQTVPKGAWIERDPDTKRLRVADDFDPARLYAEVLP